MQNDDTIRVVIAAAASVCEHTETARQATDLLVAGRAEDSTATIDQVGKLRSTVNVMGVARPLPAFFRHLISSK